MNNELTRTDTIWNKVKSFFRNIFTKKHNNTSEFETLRKEEIIVPKRSMLRDEISVRDEVKDREEKEKIAKKLLSGKIAINDLSLEQKKEMIKYFREETERINQKIEYLKNRK